MTFCEHLDIYSVQYIKTEAAYHQCNNLVLRIQDEGGNQALFDLLKKALAEWKTDNSKLRSDFCELVENGEITLPIMPQQQPRCSDCGFQVPKLEYKEWVVAHNGVAELNGQELIMPAGESLEV